MKNLMINRTGVVYAKNSGAATGGTTKPGTAPAVPQNPPVPEPATVITAANAKNSLKYRASESEGLLFVTIGGKPLQVPVKVRQLFNDAGTEGFLSFGSLSGMFQVENGALKLCDDKADLTALVNILAPKAEKESKPRETPKLDDDTAKQLADVLAKLPAGYKLVTENGSPKLVRTRTRKPKTAVAA